jgi:hypothetical protein
MGRRRACEGKIRHKDIGGAVAHARNLSRTGKGTGRAPYHCGHCGGWHVGRTGAGRLDSLNRAFAELAAKDRRNDPVDGAA